MIVASFKRPRFKENFAFKLANQFNVLNNEAEVTFDDFNYMLGEISKKDPGISKETERRVD